MDYVIILIQRKEEAVVAVNLGCGCQPIPKDILEEEIIDVPSIAISIIDEDFNFNPCRLKNKIICEYNKVLDRLECGIKSDIQNILEEISLVEINSYINSFKNEDS